MDTENACGAFSFVVNSQIPCGDPSNLTLRFQKRQLKDKV
jgi:hypothetical protein